MVRVSYVIRYALLLGIGVDFRLAWMAITVLSGGHLLFNYLVARTLRERTINRERAVALLNVYPAVLSPKEAAVSERIIGPAGSCSRSGAARRRWSGTRIRLGVPLSELLVAPRTDDMSGAGISVEAMELVTAHAGEDFVLGASVGAHEFRAVLRAGAPPVAQLRAMLVAHVAASALNDAGGGSSVAQVVSAITTARERVAASWKRYEAALHGSGWLTRTMLLDADRWRLT